MSKKKQTKKNKAKKAAQKASTPKASYSERVRDALLVLTLPGSIAATFDSPTADAISQILAAVAKAMGMGFVAVDNRISFNEQPDVGAQKRLVLLPYALFLIGEQAQPYADELRERWTPESDLVDRLASIDLSPNDGQYVANVASVFSCWSIRGAIEGKSFANREPYRL